MAVTALRQAARKSSISGPLSSQPRETRIAASADSPTPIAASTWLATLPEEQAEPELTVTPPDPGHHQRLGPMPGIATQGVFGRRRRLQNHRAPARPPAVAHCAAKSMLRQRRRAAARQCRPRSRPAGAALLAAAVDLPREWRASVRSARRRPAARPACEPRTKRVDAEARNNGIVPPCTASACTRRHVASRTRPRLPPAG